MPPQVARETIGAPVEIPVGEAVLVEAGRDRLRRPDRFRLQQARHGALGQGRRGVVPLDGHPAPLGLAQERHPRHALLGIGREGGQHALKMFAEAPDGLGLEEIGVVLHEHLQAFRLLPDLEGQVGLRAAGTDLEVAERQAGELDRLEGRVLEDEHHLEERRVAHVPHRLHHLHQPLEGKLLGRVGAERDVAHPAEQLAHGGVAAQVGAKHEGVREEADDLLGFDVGAVGDRRADGDVVEPGVTVEQHVERGEQYHEERDALFASESVQRARQRGRQHEGLDPAVEGLDRGAGVIAGQLQHRRRRGESVAPVRGLRVVRRPGQALPLPAHEVGVAGGRRPDLGRRSHRGGVEIGQVLREDSEGPPIRHDVVNRELEHVLLGGEPQQLGAEQGAGLQIERAAALVDHQPPGLRFARRGPLRLQLPDRQMEGAGLPDDLHRLPVGRGEDGAQRLVAAHQLSEAPLERLDVQDAPEPEAAGDVVGEPAGTQLVHEPEALLRERGGLPVRVRFQPVALGVLSQPPEELDLAGSELIPELLGQDALGRAAPQPVAVHREAHVERAQVGDELRRRHRRSSPHRSHTTSTGRAPTTTAPTNPERGARAAIVHPST